MKPFSYLRKQCCCPALGLTSESFLRIRFCLQRSSLTQTPQDPWALEGPEELVSCASSDPITAGRYTCLISSPPPASRMPQHNLSPEKMPKTSSKTSLPCLAEQWAESNVKIGRTGIPYFFPCSARIFWVGPHGSTGSSEDDDLQLCPCFLLSLITTIDVGSW